MSDCRDSRLSRQLEKGDKNDSWISRSSRSYHMCVQPFKSPRVGDKVELVNPDDSQRWNGMETLITVIPCSVQRGTSKTSTRLPAEEGEET